VIDGVKCPVHRASPATEPFRAALFQGRLAFCPEADFDGLEGNGDSAKDQRNGDGVGFPNDALAAGEGVKQMSAEEKCEAGQGHQDGRGAA
jgi:hypothetical protein